ncbi:MFS general substrate transporter [Flagelloscypha sp. PMI_526]|nr:MFS general substrate transporter [Flagelloscypha sp. PMI_526]
MDLEKTGTPRTDSTALDSPNVLQRYLTICGAFLGLFATFGQISSFGVFQTRYHTHELSSTSPSTIAWIGSLQLWWFFFLGWPVGRAFDCYGPRWLLCLGTLCTAGSLVLTSLSTRMYQLLLTQGLLFGIGSALVFFPSLASVSSHFTEYRATALGIAIAGSSLGGIVFPVLFERLFNQIGFGWALRVSALVTLICCGSATLMVTSYRVRIDEKETGHCFWPPCETRFVLFAAGGFIISLGLYVPIFFLPSSSHVGRVLPSLLADHVGVFNLLIPSSFFAGVSCLTFWLKGTNTDGGVIAFAVVYGFLSGAFVSLINPCISSITRREEIGARVGMIYTIVSFSCWGNSCLEQAEVSHGLIIYAGVTVVAGTLLICGSRWVIERRLFAKV